MWGAEGPDLILDFRELYALIIDEINDMVYDIPVTTPEPSPNITIPLHHAGDEEHFLREVLHTYQAVVSVFARQVGMPAARLTLMRLLATYAPDGPGVVEIARRLGVNPAAVTRQVAALEMEGLAARRQDSSDGRRTQVRLTAKGERVIRQIHARAHEFERSLSSTVSAEDIATAARVLTSVRVAVERLRGEREWR